MPRALLPFGIGTLPAGTGRNIALLGFALVLGLPWLTRSPLVRRTARVFIAAVVVALPNVGTPALCWTTHAGCVLKQTLAKLEAETVLRILSSGDTTEVWWGYLVASEGVVRRVRPGLNELFVGTVSDLSWREGRRVVNEILGCSGSFCRFEGGGKVGEVGGGLLAPKLEISKRAGLEPVFRYEATGQQESVVCFSKLFAACWLAKAKDFFKKDLVLKT
jgi:hypothetical protein